MKRLTSLSTSIRPTRREHASTASIRSTDIFFARPVTTISSVDTSNLESVYTITYTENKAMGVGNTKTYEFTPEGLKGMVDGDTLIIAAALNVPSEANQVKVTIDVPKGTYVELYYVTDSDKNWTGSKSSGFTADKEGLNEYLVDMSQKSAWKGTITQFRVDPGQTEPGMGDPEKNYFRLVSVEFLKAPSKGSRQHLHQRQEI